MAPDIDCFAVVGALTSLVFVSSASFDKRAGGKTPAGDKRSQPQAPGFSERNQEEATMAGAVRVEVPSARARVFHGDIRRLPLVKPKIKKPRPEPKDPGPELPDTSGPDQALQSFAPAAPAPATNKLSRFGFCQLGQRLAARYQRRRWSKSLHPDSQHFHRNLRQSYWCTFGCVHLRHFLFTTTNRNAMR